MKTVSTYSLTIAVKNNNIVPSLLLCVVFSSHENVRFAAAPGSFGRIAATFAPDFDSHETLKKTGS